MAVNEARAVQRLVKDFASLDFNNQLFAVHFNLLPAHHKKIVLDVFVSVIEHMALRWDQGIVSELDVDNHLLARRIKDGLDIYNK